MVDVTGITPRYAPGEARTGKGAESARVKGAGGGGGATGSGSGLIDADRLARAALLSGSRQNGERQGRGAPSDAADVTRAKSADGAASTGDARADEALAIVKGQLTALAEDHDRWHETMRQAYGDAYDYEAAETMRQQTLEGDFSWLPDIEIVDHATLNDTSGNQQGGSTYAAYSAENDTIYLSTALLEADPDTVANVLMEEIGHAIDTRVSASDSAGDEGAIFARLAAGGTLTDAELAALRAEDDTGVIVVDGREMEVEFSGGSVGDAIESVGDFLGDAWNSFTDWFKNLFDFLFTLFLAPFKIVMEFIIDLAKEALDAVMEVIGKILASEFFQKLMFVLQFIPIPIIQTIVLIVNIVKAAYMVYQGIKHGSLSMVLKGLAGLAAGMAKLGSVMGASAQFVDTMTTVAQRLNQASAMYSAMAEKDFAAALGMFSEMAEGTALAPLADTLVRANALNEARKRGDVLGMIGLGADLMADIPGDYGDELLGTVSEYATAIDAIVAAVTEGDYSKAAEILTTTFGDDLNLSAEARAHIHKVAASLERLDQAVAAFESGDFSAAAEILFDIAANHAPSEASAARFREVGESVATLGELAERVIAGDWAGALEQLAILADGPLDDPALADTLEGIGTWVSGMQRVRAAYDAGNYTEALAELDALLGLELDPEVETILGGVESLRERGIALRDAIESGDTELALAILDGMSEGTAFEGIVDGAIVVDGMARAADRGDVLGALGHGVALLELVPGDQGEADAALFLEDAATLEQATRLALDGDYDGAAALLTERWGEDVGLSPEARERVVRVAGSLELLAEAKRLYDAGDVSGAAGLLFDIAERHAGDPETAALFRDTGDAFEGLVEVIELARAGERSSALARLAELADGPLGDPAAATLLATFERWVGGAERFREAIENDDHVEAAVIFLELTEIDTDHGLRSLIGTSVEVREKAIELEAAIDEGDWMRAWALAVELAAAIDDPALSADLEALAERLRGRAEGGRAAEAEVA